MLFRIFLRLILLAGLGVPLCAFALGLGPLEVHSALNQNFEAEIPLISNNPAEVAGLKVQLPPQEVFTQTGVERLDMLSLLRFKVQTLPNGKSVIKVSSIQPLRNPNFQLLMQATWSRGRLLREYTVQLDPRLYSNRRAPPPPKPVTAEVQQAEEATPKPADKPATSLPEAPPVNFEGASSYVVRSGDTLSKIAKQTRPSASVNLPTMMSVLFAGNPNAFAGGNPNRLIAGSVLKIPTANALGVEKTSAPTPASTPQPPTTLATAPVLPPLPESPALPPVSEPAPPATEAPPVASVPLPPSSADTPSATSAPLPPPPLPTTPPVDTPSAPLVSEPSPPPGQPTAATEVLPPEPPSNGSLLPPSQLPELSPIGSAENFEEIVPEASQPQLPAPETTEAITPIPETETTVATQPEPEVEPKQLQPASPPATKVVMQQPAVEESAWWANPILWIPIALIALAIGAVTLLPLLRRRAANQSAVEPDAFIADADSKLNTPSAHVSSPGPTPESQSTAAVPEKRSTRLPAAAATMTAAATAGTVAAATSATSDQSSLLTDPKQPPKPIEEMLNDIDFGTDDTVVKPGGRIGTPAAQDSASMLTGLEPPTTSTTKASLTEAAALQEEPTTAKSPPEDLDKQQKITQKDSNTDTPSILRLDNLAFNLDAPGENTQSTESQSSPPLELTQPTTTKVADDLSPLEFDLGSFEPPTASLPAEQESGQKDDASSEIAKPRKEDLQFEFTDITQDIGDLDTLKLDDQDLQNFNDSPLEFELDKMVDKDASESSNTAAGSDYMETRIDLAAAYLDMGDQAGARSLLDEVLREGDEVQKARAQELIKKIR